MVLNAVSSVPSLEDMEMVLNAVSSVPSIEDMEMVLNAVSSVPSIEDMGMALNAVSRVPSIENMVMALTLVSRIFPQGLEDVLEFSGWGPSSFHDVRNVFSSIFGVHTLGHVSDP